MTQLKAYLERAGLRQADLAATLRISRGYMSELASGDKLPGRSLALRIQQATDGAVPMSAWDHRSQDANPKVANQDPVTAKFRKKKAA